LNHFFFFILSLSFSCSVSLRADWLPTLLTRQYPDEIDDEYAGLAAGAATVIGGLGGTALGGWLADVLHRRLRNSYLIIPGVFMFPAAGFALVLIFIRNIPAALVSITLCEICLFTYIGPTAAVIANSVSPTIRARAFGVNILAIHLFGDAWSPVVIGLLSEYTGDLSTGILPVAAAIAVAGIVWTVSGCCLRPLPIDEERLDLDEYQDGDRYPDEQVEDQRLIREKD
jgi:MFS family permease